ncbi:MAG: hypothetical protein RL204_1452 [Bacteroidota bacterium]|jgi:hypothetical protein
MADIPTIEDIKRLLDATKDQIINELESRLKVAKTEAYPEWLRTYQVKKMLNVSDATLHNYRINNILTSQKIRGSHFYLKSDVLKLMTNGK